MGIKMKLRGLLASALLALSMAAPSQSFALTNSVYLTIDASGSIGLTNWELQRDGYAAALSSVIDSSFYGDIAIGVSIFASGVNEVFAMQVINNDTDLQAVIDSITGYTYIGGGTELVRAIDEAAAAIDAFGVADNKVIDVSTDGVQYPFTTRTSSDASADALALGITTNCIGIGGAADCSFATGFDIAVADFTGFEKAMTDKLKRELGVPEPGIATLLAMGLLAIGFTRRKQSI